MSETPDDRSTVIGAGSTGSRATAEGSTTDPQGAGCAPPAQTSERHPDGGAAPSLHGDIGRALADLRRARRTAEGSTAPGSAHDVELAEWRMNRLLERR